MEFVPKPIVCARLLTATCVLAVLVAAGWRAAGVESPTSYGEAASVDTPILRIPLMKTAPVIDGVMAAGEWEDSSALSGFWYDYAQADFRFMAPPQTQLQSYVGYDRENLYVAFTSPVYPENSWLKARGRFPDVLSHPLYGMLWDDHHELEIRPYHDIAKGFKLGLFRWDVNPINAYCDWYWSLDGGQGMKWKSSAKIRCQVDGKRWVVEYAIPFTSFQHGNYVGNDEAGRPYVMIPPPDGTIYRAWFVRAIGGNGPFFNACDAHAWNTTKTQLIFDSQAPGFQVNELGPILDDIIDVTLTVKNHNTRSETVRLGFFVESAEGLIYSSYEAPELNEGLLELRPGEKREIRLQQPFPGISMDGNVLWFDVRSAGRPAKVLFRTRLIRFHSMEGGVTYSYVTKVEAGAQDATVVREEVPFRKRRIDVIEELRPPRKDFDFITQFSPYAKRLAAVVDRGIHGASDEARSAVEAKLVVMKDNQDEDEIAEQKSAFNGNFATFLLDLPGLIDGESYRASLLLFDQNRRIVGERNPEPFTYTVGEWQGNTLGLDDIVWEPFTPIAATADGFETLKHRFGVAASGLPAQVFIKPDVREIPLAARTSPESLSDDALLELGRGPQLRAPMRLEAVVDGTRVGAQVVAAAKPVRTWQSEREYASKLRVGPLDVDLMTRYDCDGSLHCRLSYSSATPSRIDSLELVADMAGVVDMVLSETGDGAMTGADVWDCTLPEGPGVVWDSSGTEMELFFSKFVPWFWFGNADRAWSWYCDSDAGWLLDTDGSTMQLERDPEGNVTWRVLFVNHPGEVTGRHEIAFSILTHPAKPKPKNHRAFSWHYFAGQSWAAGYGQEPIDLPAEYLLKRWRRAASAPPETPDDQRTVWRKDDPPYFRYGQWRNVGVCAELDRIWEDKATYYFERHVRVGRRVGWWMDEYFPVAFGRSDNMAMGNARLRDPATVGDEELPWQSGFLTTNMRNHYKRLARVALKENVPQRQHTWSNNASSMLESFIWSSLLVEECGAGHRSYEIDVVTQFPNSLYRYMCKNFTGLATTVCADATPVRSGDDKRLDRQHFGRALLNDIGVAPNGPHGTIHHKEQAARLLAELARFGFFEDGGIEKVPFWRTGPYVAVGEAPAAESEVYVTVYRRPLADGTGVKALFVIMNESFDPVELPLIIRAPERIWGGSANTLAAGTVLGRSGLPAELQNWWQGVAAGGTTDTVLRDIESGDVVARVAGAGEVYGPVRVPYHDFRVLYGEFSTR